MSEAYGSKEGGRRFDVELFIIHPTLRPDDISAALGLDAHFSHGVGEPRVTPKGNSLPGTYSDTRWRHTVRHTVQDQRFAQQIADFVNSMKPHSETFAKLRASGGRTNLVFQFLGDGYFGDEIRRDTLSTMIELGLNFQIECFADPQTG
ncbi:DUF4279 domain-containing protein [Tardiphaga sp. 768_D3_N2_1]|uniref:DUF4279 domain-containing protein n=1 Tax=Tardiphaga sp. 768_D3_N2_1 TaxID=3240783 RepID=UPI003F8CB946